MRILLVNKYYYLRSGTERYLFNLKRLLEARGHATAVFAMQHPCNRPATYSRHFVPYIDFRNVSLVGRVKTAVQVVWSPGAARRIARLLDAFRPDIVHLFNIYHQLSPSILEPIYRRGIPIVQTLNDYKLICPNYLLYTQGAVCTRCRQGHYFQAVRHRCLHDSLAWSVVAAVEMTLHKSWRIYERRVAVFIAPSVFLKTTAQAFGVPAKQLLYLPYALYPEETAIPSSDAGYLAYIGRLSREKGLSTLLRAMRQLPQARLLIVGDGPMRPALERMVAELQLSGVRFAGYLSGEALNRTLAQARFTVVPSEWYENSPYSVLESLAMGKPVVAARIGGMPELIDDGQDGLLFTPGDKDALASCLRRLWENPEHARQMGLNGRRRILEQYSPDNHYGQLYPLYERLVGSLPPAHLGRRHLEEQAAPHPDDRPL